MRDAAAPAPDHPVPGAPRAVDEDEWDDDWEGRERKARGGNPYEDER